MDVKLEILSENEAIAAVHGGARYDFIASIGNPPYSVESADHRGLLLALFRGSAAEVLGQDYYDMEGNGEGAPTLEHVREIRLAAARFPRFADCGRSCSLMVHCAAGYSRSPAFALIFLVALGFSEDQAYQKLRSLKRSFRPNRGLLELAGISFYNLDFQA